MGDGLGGGCGLRAFSGVSIGIVGSMIGIHWSLALSALALFSVVSVLMAFMLPRSGQIGRAHV